MTNLKLLVFTGILAIALSAGDLVFFGKSDSSIHHVAIYVGGGNMVEAPGHNDDCSGKKKREKKLRTDQLRPKAARFF